jgi:hypothetical protein
MFDYYYGQWGTFTGISAVSSTLFQGLQTIINSQGIILQETPNQYLDGSIPVCISFTTSWLNMAGLQGYERVYDLYLLGEYVSPHKLVISIAYNYNQSVLQSSVFMPSNYTGLYGSDPVYGQTALYGGVGSLEQFRVHTIKQLCQSFQVTVTEQFDSSFTTVPGAGLTLSGIAARVGIKKGTIPVNPTSSIS